MINSAKHKGIATSSIEAGLDFAGNLLLGALQDASADPSSDPRILLGSLAQYLRFRYVGELTLAFEELSALAVDVNSHLKSPEQFQDQMKWLERSLGVVPPEKWQRGRGS